MEKVVWGISIFCIVVGFVIGNEIVLSIGCFIMSAAVAYEGLKEWFK